MTAETCRVEPVQRVPGHAHPLASRSGLEAMLTMLEASQHWNQLSQGCRAALRAAYVQTLGEAVAAGTEETSMPTLPADTHPATVRALRRRGLVNEDGSLTPLAVRVVTWAPGARKAVDRERPERR